MLRSVTAVSPSAYVPYLICLYVFFILDRHHDSRVVRHSVLVVSRDSRGDSTPPIATSIIYSHDRGVVRSHGGSQAARHIVVVDVHELNAPPGSFIRKYFFSIYHHNRMDTGGFKSRGDFTVIARPLCCAVAPPTYNVVYRPCVFVLTTLLQLRLIPPLSFA